MSWAAREPPATAALTQAPVTSAFVGRRRYGAAAARPLLRVLTAMMRITRVPGTDGVARLHIEGRVTGDGVKELAASCEAYLAARHPLLLDLSDVTFVDEEGLRVLHGVADRGAALQGCSPFLDEMLRAPGES